MSHTPQTIAKKTAAALIREARAAGWTQARFDISPEGGVTVLTSMAEQEGHDDFHVPDLRMGR